MKILFIPLDDRPCNYLFPAELALIAGFELLKPPRELLGKFLSPGNPKRLLEWMQNNDSDSDAAIISSDMLIYGGLVASRKDQTEDYEENLAELEDWLRQTPIPKIILFGSIMRTLPTFSETSVLEAAGEIKAAFARIYAGDPDKTRIAERLADESVNNSSIGNMLESCLQVRQRNHIVNLKSLDWLKNGIVDTLILGMDDIVSNGPNLYEKKIIKNIAQEKSLLNFFIYPGIDEVAMMALAKLAVENSKKAPVFSVHYSNPQGLSLLTLYESTTVDDIVENYLRLLGCKCTASDKADIALFCHISKKGQKEAATQHMFSFNNQRKFAEHIAYLQRAGAFVAVADTAFANGGDFLFAKQLLSKVNPVKLGAFAAWNTSGNTIGTVIAHGVLRFLYLFSGNYNETAEKAHQKFILNRLADDWIYQSIIRTKLTMRALLCKIPYLSMSESESNLYSLLAEKYMKKFILNIFRKYYSGKHRITDRYPVVSIGKKIDISVFLPWRRLFEIEISTAFDLRFL